jgi:hypothetical protein
MPRVGSILLSADASRDALPVKFINIVTIINMGISRSSGSIIPVTGNANNAQQEHTSLIARDAALSAQQDSMQMTELGALNVLLEDTAPTEVHQEIVLVSNVGSAHTAQMADVIALTALLENTAQVLA